MMLRRISGWARHLRGPQHAGAGAGAHNSDIVGALAGTVVASISISGFVWQVGVHQHGKREADMKGFHKEVLARVTGEAEAEVARIKGEAKAEVAQAKAEVAHLQEYKKSCNHLVQILARMIPRNK